MKPNIKKLSFFIIIYLIFNSLLFFYFQNDKNNRTKIYFQQKVDKLFSEFRATQNSYKVLSSFVYDNINQKNDILKLIYRLSKSNIKESIPIRKKLIEKLNTFYKLLNRYNIYYVTFYFPNGEVFLRMHKPYKYGDNIYKNHRSLSFLKSSATQNIETITGITYRYPIFYKDILIANMKTSISFNVLKQELTKLFNSDYEYIINKNFISNASLQSGKKLFIQSDIDKNFFYEENSLKKDRSRINNQTIHQINLLLKDKIKDKLDLQKSFALSVKLNGKYYVVTFLTISPEIKNSPNIGYLISYEQDNTYEIFNSIFIQNLFFGNVITILILIFIYYVLNVNEKLKLIAATDKLTHLFNRNKFYEIANSEMERAKRYKRPLSIVMFDIDHFKRINDTYGHNIGDYVLKTLSKIIKENIRKNDWAFRWGGEEFIVIAPETDLEDAVKLAEKLREAVEKYDFDKVHRVTISIGVANYKEDIDKNNIDSLVNRADEALYRAKEGGRNRVEVAD